MLGQRKDALVKSAVTVSFWFGGIGLVAMKGVAYALSASALVRAAMFESIGDVLSSLILWVAQARVSSSANLRDYPQGKRRLAPLGVLFFSAFALSAMTALAIESAQGLFAGAEDEEASPAQAAREALGRLFEEKPRLRLLLSPRTSVTAVLDEYSGATLDTGVEDGLEGAKLTLLLLCGCIAIKFFCWIWCSQVAKQAQSEIARALAADHFNDVLSNTTVVVVTLLVAWAHDNGYRPAWLEKVDPTSSLLLSLWIAYGWLGSVMEQITLLSNHKVEAEAHDAIVEAARRHLEAGILELHELKAYHAGEGVAAEIEVRLRAAAAGAPKAGEQPSAEALARALEAVEQAVLEADCEVCEVHAKLRPASKLQSKEALAGQDHSWVSQYR